MSSPFSAVPPVDPKRTEPSRQIVFVDPDDDNCRWFWPAMVITKEELHTFRESVDRHVDDPADDQFLVVYFEDGSFSIVPEDDVLPFSPFTPPYTTYVSGPNGSDFCNNPAMILATTYWQKEIVPSTFTWLREENSKAIAGFSKEDLEKLDVLSNLPPPIEEIIPQALPPKSNRASKASSANASKNVSRTQSGNVSKASSPKRDLSPSNDEVLANIEGTGIYGYQTKRKSVPVVRDDIFAIVGEKRSRADKPSINTKRPKLENTREKRKPAARKGSAKLKSPTTSPVSSTRKNLSVKTEPLSASSLPTMSKSGRNTATPKSATITSAPIILPAICDKCHPTSSKPSKNGDMIIRTLCARCNGILDSISITTTPVDLEEMVVRTKSGNVIGYGNEFLLETTSLLKTVFPSSFKSRLCGKFDHVSEKVQTSMI